MKQLTKEQLEQVYREHPEWRFDIEVGKWYRVNDHLFCFSGLFDGEGYPRGYGFIDGNDWVGLDSIGWGYEGLALATHKQVAEALIAEARKRGFRAGFEVNNEKLGCNGYWKKIDGDGFVWKDGYLCIGSNAVYIFHDGHWADVREVKSSVEVGKWYKSSDEDLVLVYVTEFSTRNGGSGNGFGFDYKGNWHEKGLWVPSYFVEATPSEVEAALIAEARRRYKRPENVSWNLLPGNKDGLMYDFYDWHYEKSDNSLYSAPDGYGGRLVFRDGKWAAVITPASPLADDIQALKDKYPNYNWTIIAEEKNEHN